MPKSPIEMDMKNKETARASRSSSTDNDEPETDPKMRDVDSDDNVTGSDHGSAGDGSSSHGVSCSKDMAGKNEVVGHVDDAMKMILRKKIYDGGVGDMRIPDFQMSGCGDGAETDSGEDDDLCSTSSDDSQETHSPLASGSMPPVLPDIQLKVPMEDEGDVQRVKDALRIKGVLDVVCDVERQTVTVTAFAINEEPAHSNGVDIPSPQAMPQLTYSQRPRPTFQRYTFHNDPHSPYLRTFSPSDITSPESPSDVTGDAFDHHRRFGSSYFDEDLFDDNDLLLL